MAPHSAIVKSIEQLNYRVTVGDVAAQAGLNIEQARQGLLTLASEAGGHLQVAEPGEILYSFPHNFRAILRNKSWRSRLRHWWQRIWGVLFYLIRISFGILLILSIVLIVITLTVIFIAIISRGGDGDSDRGDRGRGGGFVFFPNFFWFGPDPFWIFYPDYDRAQRLRRRRDASQEDRMNFLEAVFSFLFGDGNPNADLEERRWQDIATVIRNNGGAVVAEQIAPYLDLDPSSERDDEDYMLPVLTRFNGYPEVSESGGIIYYFPELQVTATRRSPKAVSPYLLELPWRFSKASSGQIMLAIGLGGLNFILALMLGSLLRGGELAAEIGGLVAFVQSIYWLLLGYGTAFLAVPLVRYFWIQRRNRRIQSRNDRRAELADRLSHADESLRHKIDYARQFAAQQVLSEQEIAYSTERDLIDQEIEQSDKIDEEWRRRLESDS